MYAHHFFHSRLISAYNDKIKKRQKMVSSAVIEQYGENVTFSQFIQFIVSESETSCRL